jgi:hypothetical protein
MEDVMELRYLWMKMGLMYSTEGFTSIKVLPVTTRYVPNGRNIHIIHPGLLLEMNHPE